MNNFYSRIASIVLAFGFFFGCSVLNTTSNTKKEQHSLSKNEINNQLSVLNKRLAKSDSSADLFYQKGNLLIKLAHKKQVSERLSIYQQAYKHLIAAEKKYDQSGNVSDQDKAIKLLNVTWSNEHNQGVHIVSNDSAASVSDYKTAGNHFHNATAVIPDSATSYILGARSYYNANQPDRSINLLEEARRQIQNVPSALLEELAFLYQDIGQTDKAVRIYKQAASLPSKSTNILHGLSNAYISADDHQQAVDILKNLVEQEPKNILYKQSLATELYFLGSERVNQLIDSDSKMVTKDDFQSVDSLFQLASSHFNKLLSTNNNDLELKERNAQFYINAAAKYQKLLPKSEKPFTQTIRKRIRTYLESSLPLNKELAERNPRKNKYQQNLYQAYTYLGMTKEAQNIKSN